MGKIIEYEHHGTIVKVDEDLKGKHREHCLCWKCGNFKPRTPENCERANELFQYCVKWDMTTPVFECPAFIEK